MSYDVIGDIHGHAQKLEGLLRKLGYRPKGRGYTPPVGRQAVFLGDLIDRGPQQKRVLEIVRSMVDGGDALCIMGNHEFNAIAYVVDDPLNPGERIRPNCQPGKTADKNRAQHAEFLAQVGAGSDEHKEWVDWFRSLPVCLDLNGIRVVHGCWDDAAVQLLKDAGWHSGRPLDDEMMFEIGKRSSSGDESKLVKARKLLTCGLEFPLPDGRFILDKAGHRHGEVRIASWRHHAKALHEVALVPPGQETQLRGLDLPTGVVFPEIEGSPILVGHHWFQGTPKIESTKFACLDWSAAAGGPLVAYRWDGENELSNDKLEGFHTAELAA